MSKIVPTFCSGMAAGAISGGASALATWGGRQISYCPKLPYSASLITGAAFALTTGGSCYYFTNSRGSIEDRHFIPAIASIVLGGGALSFAFNHLYHGRTISVVGALALPVASTIGLVAAVVFIAYLDDDF